MNWTLILTFAAGYATGMVITLALCARAFDRRNIPPPGDADAPDPGHH